MLEALDSVALMKRGGWEAHTHAYGLRAHKRETKLPAVNQLTHRTSAAMATLSGLLMAFRSHALLGSSAEGGGMLAMLVSSCCVDVMRSALSFAPAVNPAATNSLLGSPAQLLIDQRGHSLLMGLPQISASMA